MFRKTPIFHCILLFFAASCTSTVKTKLSDTRYPPLEKYSRILMTENYREVPENSAFVGTLHIGDSGFSTYCNYITVMDEVRKVSRESGANIIFFTEVTPPNLNSSCYRVWGNLYRNLNEEAITGMLKKREQINASRLPAKADYALLHFYRPHNLNSATTNFKIYTPEDVMLGRARNGEKFSGKIREFGKQTFRITAADQETSLNLNIIPGNEYFIKCMLDAENKKPVLQIMENSIGIKEYDSL